MIRSKNVFALILAASMLFSGLSLADQGNQNSKGTIKNLNPNYDLKPVSKANVSAKSVRKKLRHRRGVGNCWTNSAILYKKLKGSGKAVRIVQYRTNYSPRHRSVQIYRNGRWVDYNYKGNGYASLYRATKRKPGLHVIRH